MKQDIVGVLFTGFRGGGIKGCKSPLLHLVDDEEELLRIGTIPAGMADDLYLHLDADLLVGLDTARRGDSKLKQGIAVGIGNRFLPEGKGPAVTVTELQFVLLVDVDLGVPEIVQGKLKRSLLSRQEMIVAWILQGDVVEGLDGDFDPHGQVLGGVLLGPEQDRVHSDHLCLDLRRDGDGDVQGDGLVRGQEYLIHLGTAKGDLDLPSRIALGREFNGGVLLAFVVNVHGEGLLGIRELRQLLVLRCYAE